MSVCAVVHFCTPKPKAKAKRFRGASATTCSLAAQQFIWIECAYSYTYIITS
jgi:hypothetical protein